MPWNVHILCPCRKQSLLYCWLHMIYNWAKNSLTSKGYEQNVPVAPCSSLVDLKTNASTYDRSCCKHSPVQSKWHRCNRILLRCVLPKTKSNSLFLFRYVAFKVANIVFTIARVKGNVDCVNRKNSTHSGSRSLSESKCKPRSTAHIHFLHKKNASLCNINQLKTVL